MESHRYDLLVLGGGSGGLATARRAARYGARVLLAEPAELGGTCVNRGCVPKKLLYNAAFVAETQKDGPTYLLEAEPGDFDAPEFMARSRAYVQRLRGIYQQNLEREGIEWARARATLLAPGRAQVGERVVDADHIVIATGSHPKRPPVLQAELGATSDDFFARDLPLGHIAIVGGGYIGVELSSTLAQLGSRVTLVTRDDAVLPRFDSMLQRRLMEELPRQGVELLPRSRIERVSGTPGAVRLVTEGAGEVGPFQSVIWAIGRAPNTHGLVSEGRSLAELGIATDASGAIVVDDFENTTLTHHYALGDVAGRPQLTPVAIAAGRKLSDRLFGGQPLARLAYDQIPTAVFTHPPVGTVGLTEQAARARYGDAIVTYETSFGDTYQVFSHRRVETTMKLVCLRPDETILGLHVIGRGADEMLQGFAVALRMGARKADFDATLPIHPTSAEEFVTMR